MKTKLILLFFFGIISLSVHAQSMRYAVAAPYLGLDAYSASPSTPFSFSGNQASLTKTRKPGIGLYGEEGFLLSALRNYRLSAVLPSRLGNFGIQLNYGGFSNMNHYRFGMAYARSLGKWISIGIQFSYFGYRIPSYKGYSGIDTEIGAILHLNRQLHFGLHAYNPIGKASKGAVNAVYKAGLGYDASDKFYTGIEIMKEEARPATVVAMAQYRLSGIIYVKGGFSSSPASPFLAVGIGVRRFRLDLSVSHHPQLGFSPGILIILEKNERK